MSGEYPNGNTAIGENALSEVISSSSSSRDNSAFGFNALTELNPGTNENTALGSESLRSNQTGENTAVGAYASWRVEGTHNTSVGNWALRYNAAGDDNTAVGHRALAGTLTETDPPYTPIGHRNTATGSGALRGNNKGNRNTGFGYNALYNNFNADNNTGVGAHALEANTSGEQNVALGAHAMLNNTTGTKNTGLGSRSLESMTTGISNTALGRRSLRFLTTGTFNTALGQRTGETLTTESNNTLLGAKSDITAGISFGTAIGSETTVSASNSIVLGRSGVDKVGIGVSAPASSLHINGGICNTVVQTGGGNYNATINDYIMLSNTLGVATITLPTTVGLANGTTFVIKNYGTNNLTVTTAGNIMDSPPAVGSITMLPDTTRTFVHYSGVYYVIAR